MRFSLLPHIEHAEQIRDAIEKARCEDSLLYFFERAWREIDKAPLKVNWHHDVIAEELERLAWGESEKRNILINQPPRTTKTVLTNIAFPAWVWIQPEDRRGPLSGPQVKFLCVSYGATLSETIGQKMLLLVQSEWYQKHWGDRVKIDPNRASRADFANTAGGERMSTSVHGALLGRGGDYIICDDPQDPEGAESDAERESTIRIFSEGLPTRVTDPQTSARIMVMQRLHECLLPDTVVWTERGLIPISQLNTGEAVYTSQGRQNISCYTGRKYKGFAIGIYTAGMTDPFWATPEHQVLTTLGWKAAGQLTTKDRLLIKLPKFGGGAAVELKRLWPEYRTRGPAKVIHRITGARFTAEYRDRFAVLVAQGLDDTELAAALGMATRQSAQQHRAVLGFPRAKARARELSADILTDGRFWQIVGYWLAEGSLMRDRNGDLSSTRWTFHLKETDFVSEIEEFFKEHGIPTGIDKSQGVAQVRIGCRQLSEFMAYFGEGAGQKYIPEWALSLPEKYLQKLLRGYWRGDGCLYNAEYQIRIGTSSVKMAMSLRFAFAKLGAVARIYRVKMSSKSSVIKTGVGKGRIIRSGKLPAFDVHVANRDIPWLDERLESGAYDRQRSHIVNGDLVASIRKIESKPYIGPVYDIETPAHDFMSAGLMTHNSDCSGWVLTNEADDWTHLNYPMRAELYRLCPGDPRTQDGELLWPEHWSEREVARYEARGGEYFVSGQFQQRPVPRGGGLVKREWIEPWPPWNSDGTWPSEHIKKVKRNSDGVITSGTFIYPAMEYIVGWVDTAFTENVMNDFCAMIVMGIFRAEGKGRIERRADGGYVRVADDWGFPKVLVLHGWLKRLTIHGPPEEIPPGVTRQEWAGPLWKVERQKKWGLVEWVADTVKRFKINHLGINALGGGHTLDQELRREHADLTCGVEIHTERFDKVARLLSVQGLFSSGQVFFPAFEDGSYPTWLEPMADQLFSFPKAQHDDAVDAKTGALRHLRDIGIFERKEDFDKEELAAIARPPMGRIRLPYEL